MNLPRLFVLASCLLAPQAGHAGDQPAFRACDLITRAEVEAVQGEPVLDAKDSAHSGAGFAVAQCYYSLPSHLKSISLEVTRPDLEPGASSRPRERWKAMFHGGAARDGARGGDAREAEKESSEPQPVSGVGEEAFWAGNGMVDALYVLADDSYLRVSIGGAEDAA